MTKQEAIEYIITHLSEAAILEQLGEEGAELAQAAMKLARIERGENPTPVSAAQANSDLIEEMQDVDNCKIVLFCKRGGMKPSEVARFTNDKVIRWAERIMAKEKKQNAE